MMVHVDITPYVDRLRADLAAAADAAGPEVRAAAERLGYALDPSVRLAVMDAVVQATAEITAELPAGSVAVRLAGRGLEFAVDLDLAPAPAPSGPPEPASSEDPDDATVARLTLRLPESVKARAEELAARRGHSLNTWVVNALRAATRDPDQVARADLDLSSITGRVGPRRMTGWQ